MKEDNSNIPKVIVFSNPEPVNNELEIINSLFNAGLECFHLRKPSFSEAETERFLSGIKPKYLNRLVVHAHYGLAEKYSLKGIHLTRSYLDQTSSDEISRELQQAQMGKLSISSSLHSIEEFETLKPYYDYVFLSPLFDSISKKDYKSSFNIQEIRDVLNDSAVAARVIALGGIDEENIEIARQIGFRGVALLGAIWNSGNGNAVDKFKRIKKYLKSSDE